MKPDAVVVLGCRLAPEVYAPLVATRRAEAAARAFHELGPRFVVASGGRLWGDVTEADFLSRVLVARGVPRDRIVRELCSLSTVENAWYSAAILEREGATRIALATCDWHLPRALACFAWVGIRAEPVPAFTPAPNPGVRLMRRITERARRLLDARAAARWAAA